LEHFRWWSEINHRTLHSNKNKNKIQKRTNCVSLSISKKNTHESKDNELKNLKNLFRIFELNVIITYCPDHVNE
jgi:hypothetical protein